MTIFNYRNRFVIRTCWLAFALPVFARAQTASINQELSAANPGIRRGVLDNGLTYYLLKNSNPTGQIQLALIEKAGTFQSKGDDLAVSHFVEHMSFRKTQHFPNDMMEFMNKAGLVPGLDWGGSANATTNFNLRIPSKDSLLLYKSLLILRDWAKGRLYDSADVEQEREALVNEYARAIIPSAVAVFEPNWIYLNRDPRFRLDAKTESDNVRKITIAQMKNFDRTWYRPDLQAIIIVGDIDVNEIERKVKSIFSTLQSESSTLVVPSGEEAYDVPLTGQNNFAIFARGKDIPGVHVEVRRKIKSKLSNGECSKIIEVRANLVDQLVDVLLRIRFSDLSTENQPAKMEIAHTTLRRGSDPLAGIDMFGTIIDLTDISHTETAIKFAFTELQRVQRWGFTAEEFSRAKKIVEQEIQAKKEDSSSVTWLRSLVNHYILRSWVHVGQYSVHDSLLKKISIVDVNSAAKGWLAIKENVDVVLTVPTLENPGIPKKDDVFSWITQAADTKVSPYVERNKMTASRPLLSAAKMPAKSYQSTYRKIELSTIEATQLSLSNGIRVILKSFGPLPPRVQRNQLLLEGFRLGGALTIDKSYRNEFRLLPRLISKSGVGSLTGAQLSAWVHEHSKNGYLSAGPYITENGEGVTGFSSVNNAEYLFQLVYQLFRAPKIDTVLLGAVTSDKNQFKRKSELLDQRISLIANREEDSTVPIDPVGIYESFRKYKQRMSNVAGFTFVISGYFDMKEMQQLVLRYLGSLPGTDQPFSVAKIVKEQVHRADYRERFVGDSVGNVDVHLLLPLKNGISYEESQRLKLFVEVLSAQLFERLRHKEKTVYGVQTFLKPSEDLSHYSIYSAFDTPERDVQRSLAAVMDELSTMLKGNVDQVSFDAARAKMRAEIASSNSPSEWFHYLTYNIKTGQQPLSIPSRVSFIDAITVPAIVETANKFIDVTHYSVFELL